jgi:hypothetical protein
MNKGQGEKRIDKEIFLLRNLPKEYKLGKKETQLGVLIDVSFPFIFIFQTSSKFTEMQSRASCWTPKSKGSTSTFFCATNILSSHPSS